MLEKAAVHALRSGNKAYHSMVTSGLIAYKAVDERMDAAMSKLGLKLSDSCRACIGKAKRWAYLDNNTAVDMGSTTPLTFKKQLPPAMLKCMSRYWFLRHRHALCAHMLKPCREAAKRAPLAPDTYYTVSRLAREAAFQGTLIKAATYALHGRGPNVVFRFRLTD